MCIYTFVNQNYHEPVADPEKSSKGGAYRQTAPYWKLCACVQNLYVLVRRSEQRKRGAKPPRPLPGSATENYIIVASHTIEAGQNITNGATGVGGN